MEKHGCTYFLELFIDCTTCHVTTVAMNALLTQYSGCRKRKFILSSVLNINVGNIHMPIATTKIMMFRYMFFNFFIVQVTLLSMHVSNFWNTYIVPHFYLKSSLSTNLYEFIWQKQLFSLILNTATWFCFSFDIYIILELANIIIWYLTKFIELLLYSSISFIFII